MQRSVTRIRTSHVGRPPPPKGWEDTPGRLASAEITDPAVIAAQVTPAIAETVRRQVEAGIDCIGDGEFWTGPHPRPLHRAFYRHRRPTKHSGLGPLDGLGANLEAARLSGAAGTSTRKQG
jgi:hypothetical protein